MKRVWKQAAQVLAGFFVAVVCAMPQATISARPGAINYIDGQAYLNGQPIAQKNIGKRLLDANETLSTDSGKAEMLLTPGVFLRIGDNSAVRMISPSLTHTQVEVVRGEAMVEVAELLKENEIELVNHGGSITLLRVGLYRINASDPASVAVIDGKANVMLGDQKLELGRGHETLLTSSLKSEKFDRKQEDDLYAWSNIRAEYVAGTSYASARSAMSSGFSSWNSYGYGGGYGPGWMYNSGFNSWGYLPGAGYAYSPFGWGFYSPGFVGYAPVIYAPLYGGAYGGGYYPGNYVGAVPYNPNKPPTKGAVITPGVGTKVSGSNVSRALVSSNLVAAGRTSIPTSAFRTAANNSNNSGNGGGGGRMTAAAPSYSAPSAHSSAPMASAPSAGGHSSGHH